MLGGDITPKDYCEPCASQYVEVSRAMGCPAEVARIEQPRLAQAHIATPSSACPENLEQWSRDAWFADMDHCWESGERTKRILSLVGEVETLRADRERLDWL